MKGLKSQSHNLVILQENNIALEFEGKTYHQLVIQHKIDDNNMMSPLAMMGFGFMGLQIIGFQAKFPLPQHSPLSNELPSSIQFLVSLLACTSS